MADEICGLWVGPKLRRFERLCIKSFLDHGHPFRLFTYEDVEGVPEEAVVSDAREILGEDALRPFLEEGRYLAAFSDWFRWALVRDHGAWWVDMDIICIRPFDFTQDVVWGFQTPEVANVAVLKYPKDHPVAQTMVERCENPHRAREGDSFRRRVKKTIRRLQGASPAVLSWGEAGGPAGFADELRRDPSIRDDGLPYTVFYPVHHQHFRRMFDDSLGNDLDLFTDTRALHLWNEVFKRYADIGPEGPFHPDSLFERLERRHYPPVGAS